MTVSRDDRGKVTNALTIDVEDYFQVSALASHFPKDVWNTTPCRVERNVERILAILAERGARGTFFTLGWIAERYPVLVRRIAAEGHELASHGYAHERASDQSPEAFLADIKLAKVVLEDVASCEVRGYRAPSFSVGLSNPWAHGCIEEAGYAYSSSVYPVLTGRCGKSKYENTCHASAAAKPGGGTCAIRRCFGKNPPERSAFQS